MIHEFAIEPELVVYWCKDRQEYRYIHEQFGLGRPRMMSEYPKLSKWRKQILQSAEALQDDMVVQRTTALIQALTENRINRDSSGWDNQKTWLENTEADHGRCPFHLILAMNNPRNHGRIRTPHVIGDSEDNAWNLPHGVRTARRAHEMAQAVSAMLSNSKEICFIDPYFSPEKTQYHQSFAAFFKAIAQLRGGQTPQTIEIHSRLDTNGPTDEYFREECERNFSRRIPAGLDVLFSRWRNKPGGPSLHNRYILTDLGGVTFLNGLGEGGEGALDDINLLDKVQYQDIWQQYMGPKVVFEKVGTDVLVSGTLRM
ncbi:MAG: hypothetical protein GXY07_07460 [Candidatus Hydrogenedentes bacterium]|nr:hypothetical protein [Candidatus Hydrogenedentota bacterium]